MDFIENGLRYLYNMLFSPAASKYYGLLNQGATCYLNSVLQVLFMTEDFREAVKRHTCETCGPKCIDRHLASLFDDLKGCTAYTYKITNHLGIDNVYEQRDAAEYFEKILGLTSPEASQIFHGESTHKTKCSACCEETEAGGAFWYLPLALVDSNSEDYSVVSGIKEYFRTSDFSGENQMYCDKCDAKTDATIKCVIKRHPEVLMLLLKRFEFDYSYMRYVKNNHTVDVPCTLQIPENQTYELYAVVDHFGGLRGGHYNATIKPVTIKPQEERWYKFNDDSVTVRKYQPFQVDTIEKSGSAYLLFYRKKTVRAAGAFTQDKEVSTPEEILPATDDVHERERERVEWPAQVGNNTAVSIPRNEKTGITDLGCVGELSSDFNKEDQDNGVNSSQSIPYNQQGRNEERNHLSHRQDAHAEKQHNDSGRQNDASPDVSHGLKLEVSNRPAIHGHLSKQDESSTAQRRVMHGKTDKDGKTGEETKYLGRNTEHQDNEGSDNIRQNMHDVGKQEVGQDYSLKPVNVDKQGAGGRMERDDQESSSRYKRPEQPREDKGVKEQKRGDDKDAQMRERETKRGVEDQDKRRSDGVRQNRPQQEICDTHSTHKDSVEKQAEEQGNKGDEHIQNRTDSSRRREETSQQDTLSENFANLNLSESPSQEPQKRGTKRVITNAQEENATNSTIHSDTEKKRKVSDTQEQTAEMKHALKKNSTMQNTQLKQNRKKKNNQKKTPGCFSFFCKRNAVQTSESDEDEMHTLFV
ncbi:probable ubiquitin carboxyl-terminal hydrolase creB isoform X2 [Sebastes umbrosus]|uniref:probable ubiquitin carboxyl-terminal hydrolase creB isoform X2 n=1 Tax=Sebastes umbrosus TaxID=72105 RepID=UPI00189EEC7B|nr:probable ubiquitin carboxyl-terminal hydrolase creB isoform X2 [Sebastes umbrosus]